AGQIVLHSTGNLTLQNGSSVTGIGISSFVDEGEKFSDGGFLELVSNTGSVLMNGPIVLSGNNQAAGGELDVTAAKDVQLTQPLDVTGGGGDGGVLDVDAGDNISVTKTIDVSSRVGGGFGGSITLSAGEDELGGVVAGGTLQFVGSGVALQANGGSTFDGSGGTIFLDSGDDNPNVIGPTDGNILLAGSFTMNSGGAGGDGGDVDMSAGRDFTLTGSIDVSGQDSGGDVSGDAGGAILLSGTITSQGIATYAGGGYIDFMSGLASNAGITIAKNILAPSGSANGAGQS